LVSASDGGLKAHGVACRSLRQAVPPTRSKKEPFKMDTLVNDLLPAGPAGSPQRDGVVGHPMYDAIDRIDDVRIFMQSHVFAVWDFMSLLKRLQRDHTCVEVPWLPTTDPRTRRLVNLIVLAEESDVVGDAPCSHFELYLSAMAQAGADTGPILRFVGLVGAGVDVSEALRRAGAPPAAADFVDTTFEIVVDASSAEVAAVFAYTREDLVPEMFTRILARLQPHDADLTHFASYLERHVELDSGEHFPLAHELVERLCGDNVATRARCHAAVARSLEARRALWDGVYRQIDG
jgi:hypothetical protein